MIKQFELKNFTAFRKLTLDLSPKINVIIGENSTGKTHLLKAAYALHNKIKPDAERDDVQKLLTAKFLQLFLPFEEKVWKLRRQGAPDETYLLINWLNGQKAAISFNVNSRLLSVENRRGKDPQNIDAVFIPTKEVISFMEGFNSLYQKFEVSFDQTYHDICVLLDLPKARPETLHKKSKWAMEEIESTCGGRFVFYGGGRVTFMKDNVEYSANVIAEGFRKLGVLSRLLETSAINPGISGALFWDEPESSLNPMLMELLVKILLELSRIGQQIILTTHDYVLLKWFDLLMDKDRGDQVRFHSLFRDAETSEVKASSTDNYVEIAPNSLDETFALLVEHELRRDMGDIGQ
ncbi:MAG: AAA family ATPase [Gammaproteobacteria bacterium]|nr:AAA family ATPase [Gammaproteobacteria bacterium]